MAMGANGGAGGLHADMNVTPLIDVLLVLLIIFMVIVPVVPRGLNSLVPQPAKGQDRNPDSAIVVQVLAGPDGQPTYKINQDDVTVGDLSKRLTSIFSTRANRVLFIKGDGSLDFSTIAEVMDIGKSAGADRVALLTPKGNAL
jgi:biopolymer transport protein ExbD